MPRGGWPKNCKTVIILLLVWVGFFYCQNTQTKAISTGVVINEIMVGRDGESKYEFIELFNNSDDDIDLAGYSLKKKTQSGTESNLVSQTKFMGVIPAKGYFLVAQPDYQNELQPDLVYSGVSYSIAMNNTVLLYDADGALMDKVGFGEAGDYESAPASEFLNGQSLERINPGADTDDNSGDFIITNIPSPGENRNEAECGNAVLESGEECDDGNRLDGDGCSQGCLHEENIEPAEGEAPKESIIDTNSRPLIKKWEVVINELVVDPSDDETEWVELYNTLAKDIDISGWTLEEGSGAKTILSGKLGQSNEEKYYIIVKPKGSLNNTGDTVILRDENGAFIDQVTYGDWEDGNMNDNAPAASDPLGIARKKDGVSSGNNSADFAVTETLTKGQENIISARIETDGTAVRYDLSPDIVISEIFPDPIGGDGESEFVEIYNMGGKIVDLNLWQLGDNSKKRFSLSGKIDPGEYMVIYRGESGLALNNNGETVKLFRPGEEPAFQEVSYDQAKEGLSYNCLLENMERSELCVWSETVTPGLANRIIIPNNLPQIEIDCPGSAIKDTPFICDASDSIDLDNDKLSFFWDFGDGHTNKTAAPEHVYSTAGKFTIFLTVFDGRASTSAEHKINVSDTVETGTPDTETGDEDDNNKIIINEFLPNPQGSDAAGEWIELKNIGESAINIMGWQIDDEPGGSRPFKIFAETWLAANEYLVIKREDSGLALNNSGDQVRLLAADGSIIDEISYLKVFEGASYARGNDGNWYWTTRITEGGENEIKAIKEDDNKIISAVANDSLGVNYLDTALSNIRDCDIGDKVRASGTVAVLPGILGTQYFYIVAGSGVQIYNYNKDFPELEVGDIVEVQGEVSRIQGEARIKTKEAGDIKLIEKGEACEPLAVSCSSVQDDMVGSLIKIEGDLLEKQGAYLYLSDESGEAQAYIKPATDISTGDLAAGDKISVVGIVSKTQSGLRLLPRQDGDIVKLAVYQEAGGKVLGEAETRDVWALSGRNRKKELFSYILGIAGTLAIIFSVMYLRIIFRERREKEG